MDSQILLLINPFGLSGSLDDHMDEWMPVQVDDQVIVEIEEMAHGQYHVKLTDGVTLLVERNSMAEAYKILEKRGRV